MLSSRCSQSLTNSDSDKYTITKIQLRSKGFTVLGKIDGSDMVDKSALVHQ